MNCLHRVVVLIAGILGATAVPLHAQSPAQEMEQLRSRHEALLKSMNEPDAKHKVADLDDASMEPLLDEGWQLAGVWAADWLEQHPGATSKARRSLFQQLSPSPDDSGVYDPNKPDSYALGGFATPIGNGVYVVAAAYYHPQSACGVGTFLVVSHDAKGHLQPQWSVKPIARQHFEARDEIGHWAYLGCGGYYNGPLIAGQVITLPAARNGELRFAVDATEATNGSTLLHHLSVWQWKGREAVNLLAGAYQDYIDDKRASVLQDGMLILPTTEVTSSFASFGAAQEPRGEWRIRLTPDAVRDLGHRYLNPQVAWLDALLSAVAAGRDAKGLASPAAIAQVTAEWKEDFQAEDAQVRSELKEQPSDASESKPADAQPADSRTAADSERDPSFFLGFLYRFRATGPGSFAVDCDEARIRVTYRMRVGKPYITSVRFLEPR
jgi:hypothetical protein